MDGKELKLLRENLGLTQKQLAEVLEVKTNTVYRWEVGLLKVPKTVELSARMIDYLKSIGEQSFLDSLLKVG